MKWDNFNRNIQQYFYLEYRIISPKRYFSFTDFSRMMKGFIFR